MKKLNTTVLFVTSPFQDAGRTQVKIEQWKKTFLNYGIEIDKIEDTTKSPFGDRRYYDILIFDWGGGLTVAAPYLHGSVQTFHHYCKQLLDEALEKPSKIYIIVSGLTWQMVKESTKSFIDANGELPPNIFFGINDACKFLNQSIFH